MDRARMKFNFGCSMMLFLVSSHFVFSQQKQSIEKRISDDICECFGEYGFEVADQRINQAMDTCSNKTVKNYQAELEAYFAASKNADYNTGYQAGKLFFQQKVAPLLFRDCEALTQLENSNP
jgi:hypothetical protein